MDGSRLLALPAELRNTIYAEVLESGEDNGAIELRESTPPRKALLLTCKTTYRDLRAMYKQVYQQYWRQNHFVLDLNQSSLGATRKTIQLIQRNDCARPIHLPDLGACAFPRTRLSKLLNRQRPQVTAVLRKVDIRQIDHLKISRRSFNEIHHSYVKCELTLVDHRGIWKCWTSDKYGISNNYIVLRRKLWSQWLVDLFHLDGGGFEWESFGCEECAFERCGRLARSACWLWRSRLSRMSI